MNIHYRNSKICKVDFYEAVCAILALCGTNITILVHYRFFFSTATAVQRRTKDLAKWRKTGGLGAGPPAASRFLLF